MEKKFSGEVTIVLLPPLLNQFELNSETTTFLDLTDIISLSSSSIRLNEKTEEGPSALVNRIAKVEFGKEIVGLIDSRNKELAFTKVMLINYPMNKNQLEDLEKNLALAGFNICKLIVTSLASFDVLVTAKDENFLCPICFKSYAKKAFLRQDKYLCPLDNEDFSVSYIDKFTDHLTKYYLQNSIEVVQSFTKNEKERGRKILNLNINSGDSLAEVAKSLLSVAQKE